MRKGYSVTVSKDGESILTIGRSMVSGRATLSDDEAAAIRDAGHSLLSFIGPEKTACFVCGGIDECWDNCALKSDDSAATEMGNVLNPPQESGSSGSAL
jgi:hypothetical protein